jgi:hypothetical protein
MPSSASWWWSGRWSAARPKRTELFMIFYKG